MINLDLLTMVYSTHRNLDDNIGLFSFVSWGRKEDPTKKDLSMQTYLTPELYSNPPLCDYDCSRLIII
jgi:hypothetical protein